MKDVNELLRQKELEVARLQKEVEVLHVVAPLLTEGENYDQQEQELIRRREQLIDDLRAQETSQQARMAWPDRAKEWLKQKNA